MFFMQLNFELRNLKLDWKKELAPLYNIQNKFLDELEKTIQKPIVHIDQNLLDKLAKKTEDFSVRALIYLANLLKENTSPQNIIENYEQIIEKTKEKFENNKSNWSSKKMEKLDQIQKKMTAIETDIRIKCSGKAEKRPTSNGHAVPVIGNFMYNNGTYLNFEEPADKCATQIREEFNYRKIEEELAKINGITLKPEEPKK